MRWVNHLRIPEVSQATVWNITDPMITSFYFSTLNMVNISLGRRNGIFWERRLGEFVVTSSRFRHSPDWLQVFGITKSATYDMSKEVLYCYNKPDMVHGEERKFVCWIISWLQYLSTISSSFQTAYLKPCYCKVAFDGSLVLNVRLVLLIIFIGLGLVQSE